MVDEQQVLTWKLASQLLDANFHFRSQGQGTGESRSYRAAPNGPELRIWSERSAFFIELPSSVSAFQGVLLEQKTLSGFRYEVKTVAHLITAIASLTNVVIKEIPIHEHGGVDELKEKMGMRAPLNSILYGPPGTGKTHKTAQLAVEICDGSTPDDRDELMARYEELRSDGRISFVTFHQSYGYEDFVEGLRPEMTDGQVTYRIRPGVFRDVCDTARRNTLVKPGLSGKPLKDRTIFKMSLGAAGTTEGRNVFQACIENGIVLLGWGDNVDFSECRNADEVLKKATDVNAFENPKVAAGYIDTFKHTVQVGDIIVASHGNRAFQAIGEVIDEYEFLEAPLAEHFHQKRAVRWLAVYEAKHSVEEIYDRNFSQSSLYTLDHTGVKFDVLESLLTAHQSATNMPFVLIIDEINRANISKVFGELITLLEEGKREGATNALTVKLPYSGDEFCVPANLHVIGTMNTADRSIALLDTALRRRFEFEELQPDVAALPMEPVDGIDLRGLLQAINERIEYLYDRDHTIGHAYFIGVKSLAELEGVFRRKVIPLLQEYFYENWSKVRAVLNDTDGAFIEVLNNVPRGLESVVDGFDPRPRYRVNGAAFTQAAFARIYE